MPDERKSRVRGAEKVKVREKWRYDVPEMEFIDRLNFVRQQIGDRQVTILTGMSTKDPSYKTVRRWAAGTRIPGRDTYEKVLAKYDELKSLLGIEKLVDVAAEIRGAVLGLLKDRYVSKINSFLRVIRPHILRKEPAEGMEPSVEARDRMQSPVYMRTCNEHGSVMADGKQAIALLMLHVKDYQEDETHTEIYLIRYIDHPSLTLFKNALDTWVEGLPQNQSYKTFWVRGVWFSYA